MLRSEVWCSFYNNEEVSSINISKLIIQNTTYCGKIGDDFFSAIDLELIFIYIKAWVHCCVWSCVSSKVSSYLSSRKDLLALVMSSIMSLSSSRSPILSFFSDTIIWSNNKIYHWSIFYISANLLRFIFLFLLPTHPSDFVSIQNHS